MKFDHRLLPYLLLAVVLSLLVYFPLFLHLDSLALYRWDEATNAMQAFEMSENGHYLRRFFLNQPDTWETKPPMLIWCQVFWMKVIGYNELAVRLPSVLAVLATFGLILWFFIKQLRFLWGGIFTVMVLITSGGYIRTHVARSGDHDALLIFFLVAGLISWLMYLQDARRRRYLMIFVLALVGGVLTKSVAGLFFGPGLLIFTLLSGHLLEVMRRRDFWFAVMAVVGIIGGFYGLNEYYYPGYWRLVWENELFPRFFNTATTYQYQTSEDNWYYLRLLVEKHFKWYWPLVPLSLLLTFFQKDQKLRQFISLVALTAILFIGFISKGTINNWYDAPAIPLLAIIVGTGLGLFWQALNQAFVMSKWQKGALIFCFFVTIFTWPYIDTIQTHCYRPQRYGLDTVYGDFFKKLRQEHPDWKDIFVFYEPLNAHFLFYEQVYIRDHNYRIRSCGPGRGARACPPDKRPGAEEKIMVCKPELREELHELYELKEVRYFEGCHLYEMVGVRDSVWFTEAPR